MNAYLTLKKKHQDEINAFPMFFAFNQNQFDAMISFIYNVATGNFSRSTLLRKVRANPQDNSIMDEFLRWVYSKDRVIPGLQRRRLAEMKLYFSND